MGDTKCVTQEVFLPVEEPVCTLIVLMVTGNYTHVLVLLGMVGNWKHHSTMQPNERSDRVFQRKMR